MEFGQEDLRDQYSDNKEEYQEEQEEDDDHNHVRNTINTTTNTTSTRLDPLSFCAPSSSSSPSSSSKKWPQIITTNNTSTGNNSHLQLTDYLSLRTSHGSPAEAESGDINTNNNFGLACWGEREHMFDKVVTPSDVGKLNRLVIPKQHAEKYFPLDSASNEKGLLLNFEDRSGKSWRFRYSYWNSSQSYVMTKGWSRFVKEKKLDAGDIVSFERQPAAAGGSRLFIDWRRRTHHHHHLLSNPALLLPMEHHHHHHHRLHLNPYHQQPRWGGGDGGGMLQPLPLSMSLPPSRSHENLQYSLSSSVVQCPNYNYHHHHHHRHQNQHQYNFNHQDYMNYGQVPVLINSRPPAAVAAEAAVVGPSKRLRLFGVNMEYCPNDHQEGGQASSDHHDDHHDLVPLSSVQYPIQVRIPTHSSPILPLPRPTSTFPAEFSQYKGKSANNSLSFDLD